VIHTQVGNACVVIMQLASDAKDVACLQAFGRLRSHWCGVCDCLMCQTNRIDATALQQALLDVIKRVRGTAQKNAAIAGAFAAKFSV